MNRSITPLILWSFLLLSVDASGQTTTNRYGRMAESMLDMMDAFASAYQKRQGSAPGNPSRNWGGSAPWSQSMQQMGPWGGGMPWGQSMNPWSLYNPMANPMGNVNPFGMTTPGSMPWPQMPGSAPANPFWGNTYQAPPAGGGTLPPPARSPLDGRWQGRSGEILEVRDGRFRIYQDADSYREGVIDRVDDSHLSMRDPASGVSRDYEYAVNEGRLVLRDDAGNLLLYRQINP
ncbi:MAG TPA: hypothetical protein ENI96_02690 [Sedimenticola thiotaurini]|uniref:Uncharacterized protein n=1 Tax=Sedimenticola thiotaurini TaxID=1543721 RepID=A0A831RKZ4_9GAMM|nr:hypothetical protein [Sedimenticola thiotaurini]